MLRIGDKNVLFGVISANVQKIVTNKLNLLVSEDGNSYSAIIYDADGNEVLGVPVGELVLTPASQMSNELVDESIRYSLNAAYEEIINISNLGELCPNLNEYLDEYNGKYGTNIIPEDLITQQLFNISLYGISLEYASADNTVTFELKAEGFTSTDFVCVLQYNAEGDRWDMISTEFVEILEDGNIKINYDSYNISAGDTFAIITPSWYV